MLHCFLLYFNPSAFPNMSTIFNLAIIGVGIGRQHLRGALGVPNVRIAALCDVNIERAQQLAQEFDLKNVQIVADYRELFQLENLDAVSVCVPNALHATIAIACLSAGLHVLCEKPLALSAADAQQIADAARDNSRACMVGQLLRFRDDVRALKARADQIGTPYYARAVARRASGIPKWGSWFTQKQMAGGGPLIDTGVHIIDLAWWLANCPRPLSASATTYGALGARKIGLGAGGVGDPNGTFDVEDLAAGLIRFEGGFSIHFESSWALYAENDTRLCHVHGTDGALLWGDDAKIIAPDGTLETLDVEAGDAWRAEIEHFVTSIQNGIAPQPDATTGVTMMKMLDALYQSARENREVEIV